MPVHSISIPNMQYLPSINNISQKITTSGQFPAVPRITGMGYVVGGSITDSVTSQSFVAGDKIFWFIDRWELYNTGTSSGDAPAGASYTTINNEIASLVNSRQWINGNITTVNITTANKIKIDVDQSLISITTSQVSNFTSAVNALVNGTYLPLAGGTMTGFLTLNAAPTAPLHAATKGYVDLLSSYTAGTGLTLTGNIFSLTSPVLIANGGTGSTTQNFVDLTTTQSNIAGLKTFTDVFTVSNASSASGFISIVKFLRPNMPTGSFSQYEFGHDISSANNAAQYRYYYSGSTSVNNFTTIGLSGTFSGIHVSQNTVKIGSNTANTIGKMGNTTIDATNALVTQFSTQTTTKYYLNISSSVAAAADAEVGQLDFSSFAASITDGENRLGYITSTFESVSSGHATGKMNFYVNNAGTLSTIASLSTGGLALTGVQTISTPSNGSVQTGLNLTINSTSGAFNNALSLLQPNLPATGSVATSSFKNVMGRDTSIGNNSIEWWFTYAGSGSINNTSTFIFSGASGGMLFSPTGAAIGNPGINGTPPRTGLTAYDSSASIMRAEARSSNSSTMFLNISSNISTGTPVGTLVFSSYSTNPTSGYNWLGNIEGWLDSTLSTEFIGSMRHNINNAGTITEIFRTTKDGVVMTTGIFKGSLGGTDGNQTDARFTTPVITITSSTVLGVTHWGKRIILNSVSAITITLPQQSTLATVTGVWIEFENINTGLVTFEKQGSEGLTGNVYAAQNADGKIFRDTTTSWNIFGGTAIIAYDFELNLPTLIDSVNYFFTVTAPCGGTILDVSQIAGTLVTAGTYTVAIEGANVGGLTGVTNTTAKTITAATSANTFLYGDAIFVSFSGTTSIVRWQATMRYLRNV